ncbi:hypothetical protein SRABI128_05707 [Microbacterium sp. Bi128]|nr:hypothetical protein SRABI128_05707 [Microbacterium sp. Bi128]
MRRRVRVAQGGDDVPDQLPERLGRGGFSHRPGRGPELQDGVPDLLPREEPLTAAQLVADPRRGQRLFVGFGLPVGAEEHGDLARRCSGVEEFTDPRGDSGGLRLVIRAFGEPRHRARRPLRYELQRRGPGGVRHRAAAAPAGEEVVGEPDDLGRGPVVPDQLNDVGLGIHRFEPEQVLRGGAGEGVDGLAGVAHDAELVASAEPQLQEPLLQRRDVLVLVDDEVPVLFPDGRCHLWVLLQDPHGDQQHVLEVDDVAVGLDVLIGLEDPCHGRQVEAARIAPALGVLQIVRRGQHGYLGPLDFGGEVPDGGAVRAEPEPPRGLGNHLCLVVQQVGQGAADRLRPEELQLAQRRGVEGTGLNVADAEVTEPAAHLGGSPGREGDSEEPLRAVHP